MKFGLESLFKKRDDGIDEANKSGFDENGVESVLEKMPERSKAEQLEKFSSKIELNFFRHADKENDKTKDDNEIRLNEAGRGQSINKSVELKNPRLAKAYGSPRVRAQETAGLVMEGNRKGINSEEGADDVQDIADRGLFNSPRIAEDERLNFLLNPKEGSGALAMDAFKKGEYLKFLVEESDEKAREFNDADQNSTYSGSASKIASIIKDYYSASSRWDDIVKAEDTRKFPKGYDKTLERFMGSHMGVNESFLAKVIEKIKGVSERDKFVKALGNNGFTFVEGFKTNVVTVGDKVKINIEYKKEDENGETLFGFNEEIPEEMIDEIIEEGKI